LREAFVKSSCYTKYLESCLAELEGEKDKKEDAKRGKNKKAMVVCSPYRGIVPQAPNVDPPMSRRRGSANYTGIVAARPPLCRPFMERVS